jgi:hypothetical protein
MAPTAVRAAAGDLVVCDAPPAGTTVLKANETQNSEPASPELDPVALAELGYSNTSTDLKFQLDLYPATATSKANVSSTLNWELDANDWDLFLLDNAGNELAGSENFQFGPLEDPPTEAVAAKLTHCSLFTISVFNYQAVAADELDPLQLQVRAGAVT